MPSSIKKKVTGFIRQLSAPGGAAAATAAAATATAATAGAAAAAAAAAEGGNGGGGATPSSRSKDGRAAEGFIQRYLSNGESHDPGPSILSGKTGHDLPVLRLCTLSPEIFAAFTGPDGGITSIAGGPGGGPDGGTGGGGVNGNNGLAAPPNAAEDSEDFDFIDIDDLGGSKSRRQSEGDASEEACLEQGEASHTGDKAVMKARDKSKSSAAFQRRQRELSVESDYPELGMDFPMRPPPHASGNSAEGSPSRGAGAGAAAVNAHLLTRRLKQDLRNDCETAIAGVRHWNRPNNAATGQAVTLYERHPHTAEHAGSPIADTFAVVARKNCAIMALGDGVNWGARAALASRCAVHGAVETLNAALFSEGSPPKLRTTQEVFQCLLRSFHAAHSLILHEEAHLTTLTACVVLPVQEKEGGEERFAACVCNVGDSLAYVYSRSTGHVREITQGSHDIRSNRDMRDALGALGPVDGINPELSNLTCSLTFVDEGDIVFLTSDGVSDNFDPVVGKFCAPAREGETPRVGAKRDPVSSSSSSSSSSSGPSASSDPWNAGTLPTVEAYQRHELTLLRMEDILNRGSEAGGREEGRTNGRTNGSSKAEGGVLSSAELCQRLVDFCQRLTAAKRRVLEDPELYSEHSRHALPDSDATRAEQKMRRRRVCEKLAMVPGKLDHATVVAFTVEDRRKSLRNYAGTRSDVATISEESSGSCGVGANATLPSLRAPCASSEDLTFRDSSSDEDEGGGAGGAGGVAAVARIRREEATPTPSDVSLDDDDDRDDGEGGGDGGDSLAVTPVHHPRQDIDLCFDNVEEDKE